MHNYNLDDTKKKLAASFARLEKLVESKLLQNQEKSFDFNKMEQKIKSLEKEKKDLIGLYEDLKNKYNDATNTAQGIRQEVDESLALFKKIFESEKCQ